MEGREVVRFARAVLGMHQEQFADWIGVTARTVQRWESGKSAPPEDVIARLLPLAESGAELWQRLDRLESKLDSLIDPPYPAEPPGRM